MYIPSDVEGGRVPGYNLNQRAYLLRQRGYPAEEYERRLEVVETLYASDDESNVIMALHYLKELQRPVAIHFANQDTYSLQWLEMRALGRTLFMDGQNIIWLVDNPSLLP
jgi:hypothetical protein